MRQFSFLMLAAALCLPMVGCGGDATEPAAETPAAGAAEDGSGTTDAEEGSGTEEASEEAAE